MNFFNFRIVSVDFKGDLIVMIEFMPHRFSLVLQVVGILMPDRCNVNESCLFAEEMQPMMSIASN